MDYILVVLDWKTGCPDAMEYGTGRYILDPGIPGIPWRSQIPILVADQERLFENMCTCHRLESLICATPQRCPDSKGSQFTIAGLARIGFADDLIFLCQSWIERFSGNSHYLYARPYR